MSSAAALCLETKQCAVQLCCVRWCTRAAELQSKPAILSENVPYCSACIHSYAILVVSSLISILSHMWKFIIHIVFKCKQLSYVAQLHWGFFFILTFFKKILKNYFANREKKKYTFYFANATLYIFANYSVPKCTKC